MSVSVALSVESPLWSAVGDLAALTEQAVAAAVAETEADLPATCEVSCLFCDDATIRSLNAQWRGIDKPTNVLSFPAGGPRAQDGTALLGDIVMAYETVSREAQAELKPIKAHVTHLVIHGFLHLIGYDHEDQHDAEAMEDLESRAMKRLGCADPWLPAVAGRDSRSASDAP